jgi:hypothetical protein
MKTFFGFLVAFVGLCVGAVAGVLMLVWGDNGYN